MKNKEIVEKIKFLIKENNANELELFLKENPAFISAFIEYNSLEIKILLLEIQSVTLTASYLLSKNICENKS